VIDPRRKLDFSRIVTTQSCQGAQHTEHPRVDLLRDLVADPHGLFAERGQEKVVALFEQGQRFQDLEHIKCQWDEVRPRILILALHPFGRNRPGQLFGF